MLVLISIAVVVAVIGSMYLGAQKGSLSASLGIATGTPVATSTPTESEARSVDFRTLDIGAQAASISARKNYAVYTEAELAKLWGMIHGSDGSAIPKIDFSKEYVIGVFSGQKPTGGHSISISSIIDTSETRVVAVKLTSPGADCIVTQVLTSPYQIVAVPLSENELGHTNTEVASACN